MHILPHISLLLALSRSAFFILSWCFWLLTVSDDHSVTATAPIVPPIHFLPTFSNSSDDAVLVLDPMYCTVSCCTMWLSFATLPVIVLEEKQSCLYFYLSFSIALSGSSLASLCLPLSLQFSVLFFVLLHHFIPLESPRHASDLWVQSLDASFPNIYWSVLWQMQYWI